jgi:hypothetical protein
MCQKMSVRLIFVLFFLSPVLFVWAQNSDALFKLIPSSYTGITFNNLISENDTLNILNQANIYNGGGVGIGDFNNDGLMYILQETWFQANFTSTTVQ